MALLVCIANKSPFLEEQINTKKEYMAGLQYLREKIRNIKENAWILHITLIYLTLCDFFRIQNRMASPSPTTRFFLYNTA